MFALGMKIPKRACRQNNQQLVLLLEKFTQEILPIFCRCRILDQLKLPDK